MKTFLFISLFICAFLAFIIQFLIFSRLIEKDKLRSFSDEHLLYSVRLFKTLFVNEIIGDKYYKKLLIIFRVSFILIIIFAILISITL